MLSPKNLPSSVPLHSIMNLPLDKFYLKLIVFPLRSMFHSLMHFESKNTPQLIDLQQKKTYFFPVNNLLRTEKL